MTYEYFTFNEKRIALNGMLKKKLDIVLKLQSKKWDVAFVIDGDERVGKSTLALTLAWYLSKGTITINNLCKGSFDAKKKIKELPDESILILDESSLIFGSMDAMTREQKEIIKILNVVGQKKMIFILVCPSFFKLNWDIAVRRTKFLIHAYAKNFERGRFIYFNNKRKKILYELGKKNYGSYSKPKANFNGSFLDFNPFGQEYLDLKKDTLYELLEGDEKAKLEKSKTLKTQVRAETYQNLMSVLKIYKIKMKKKDIGKICGVNDGHFERLQPFLTASGGQ